MRGQARLTWGLVALAWTLVGVLFASQTVVYSLATGMPMEWRSVGLSFAGAYTWILFTALIFWVSRRWPLTRLAWRRNLPAHLVALLVILPLDSASFLLIDQVFFHSIEFADPQPTLAGNFLRILIWSFGISTVWFFGVDAGGHALEYRRKSRERQLRSSELESRLTQARLQVLRMQLQPHFLFNTLHAISALVNEEPQAAGRMIGRLSDLLRRSFQSEGRQEVPLREELELLRPYLEIEKTRFQDRLDVRQEIEAEALDAKVPNLVLQPLVENGIRHGIATRAGPGRLEIRARRLNGRLEIEVRDNGRGIAGGAGELREGVGLGNTRARLRQLYGEEGRLELRNLQGGGFGVVLTLPFRPDQDPGLSTQRAPQHDSEPGGRRGPAGLSHADGHGGFQ